MKQLLFFFVILFVFSGAKAQTVNHTFCFKESEFSITTSSSDSLIISSLASPSINPDVTEPKIPILARSIAIPRGTLIADYTVSVSKRPIRENVDLIKSSLPTPTSMSAISFPTIPPDCYIPKIYPDSNCVVSSTLSMGEAQIVDFLVVPYVFDAVNRKLYFVDSISVQLNLVNDPEASIPTYTTQRQYDEIASIVENPQFVSSLNVGEAIIPNEDRYEYLIITNESLRSSFRPLAKWKRKKGVSSKIITTEEIDSIYNDATQQMRIKQCIKDAWQDHGTTYVLLGGDTNVIPAQYCKMYNDRYLISDLEKKYYTIPADIYYACFSQIDWDTNNDGFAGDFWKDDINVFPEIDISRLPIHTDIDCQTVVNRIIEYEQNPRINRCFFQAGTKMNSNILGKQMGDVFFNKIFNNGVSIERDTLFTNIYVEQNFTNNFAHKFAAGPSFAQLICHGGLDAWGDKYFTFFTGENAESFNNPNHTFVSTISCLTNAYDDMFGDKCLSEILMRNPNSGIIGYLGSSRYGWFSSSQMTLSMGYEKEFYERLFDPDRQNSPGISFGTLVTEVKRSFRSLAESSETYRQLQYAINPIGDPEMPIFTEYPSEFSTATANIDTFDRLTVITGEDNARVCVSNRSRPGNSDATGGYYQVGYGNKLVFENVPMLCDVWITKQNFTPKYFSLISPSAIVNPNEPSTKTELLLVMLNSETSQMTVRFTRNSQNSTIKLGVIPISGGNSYLFPVTDAYLVEEDIYEANVDLWGVSKGAYVVKLYEDSIVAEKTFKIIKQ